MSASSPEEITGSDPSRDAPEDAHDVSSDANAAMPAINRIASVVENLATLPPARHDTGPATTRVRVDACLDVVVDSLKFASVRTQSTAAVAHHYRSDGDIAWASDVKRFRGSASGCVAALPPRLQLFGSITACTTLSPVC